MNLQRFLDPATEKKCGTVQQQTLPREHIVHYVSVLLCRLKKKATFHPARFIMDDQLE